LAGAVMSLAAAGALLGFRRVVRR